MTLSMHERLLLDIFEAYTLKICYSSSAIFIFEHISVRPLADPPSHVWFRIPVLPLGMYTLSCAEFPI